MESRRLSGNEPFHSDGHLLRKNQTVLSFWQWSASNLLDNTQRGILAEYLVALAIGAHNRPRPSVWRSYDLETPDGFTIEVKSSAYIQNWRQKAETTPRFSIRPALVWNFETNRYSVEERRTSDLYVFCLHKHRFDRETLDLLNMSQWDFYIVPTDTLDQKLKHQKTIGLSWFSRLGARPVSFELINYTIQDLKPILTELKKQRQKEKTMRQ